jgi:phage recombination protein Bet
MNQIALREPGQRSVLLDMSDRYGMEPAAFEATLRATVVPSNCSREQFAAFLLIAKEYKLNPILKEIYAFPSKGGIQPIVGVDGWANLINSHPSFDGMDFEDRCDDKGELVSITCRMHRKDRSHPITATEYLAECKRATDPWKQWPRRMLRHKAMIQAARYAFSFAGIVDPDEAERFAGEFAQDVTPRAAIVPISQRIAAQNPSPTEGGANQNHASEIDTNPPAGEMTGQAGEAPATDFIGDGPSPDTPAASSSPAPQEAAGEPSQESSTEVDDAGGGDENPKPPAPSPPLPQGWPITYSAALRRAQKKESLSKYASEYWKQYGGWDAHKNGDNGPTAMAVYNAFANNFGNKDAIERDLREVI